MHEHHRNPRAFGGGNETENLVWLCTSCHTLLHRLAPMFMSGKAGLVNDYIEQYLPDDPQARVLFKDLIQDVVKASIAFGDKELDKDDLVTMQIKIPRTLHSLLKTIAMDFTHKSGRPMGLYSLCVAALKKFAMTEMFGFTNQQVDIVEQPDKEDLYEARTSRPPTFKRFG